VRCSRCNTEEPETGFSPSVRAKGNGWCRGCIKAYRRAGRPNRTCAGCGEDISERHGTALYCSQQCCQKSWNKANPDKRKWYVKKWKYGVGEAEWNALFEAQGNRCAICRTTEDEQWSLDHCHSTGEPRGVLCRACNVGIGQLKDDPNIVRAALAYLEG
jgi:hypothetical protein